MDCSMPGFSLFHYRHWVSDAIQPSHLLLPPSPFAFDLFQHQDLFRWVGSSHQVTKVHMHTRVCVHVNARHVYTQSCPTIFIPSDHSPPGSSVHGISQARILKGVALSSSRDLPDPVIEPTSPALTGRFFTAEPPGQSHVAVGVQALNCVWLFVSPWTRTWQTSLSFIISWICSDSCPLSQWCHPTLSSSVIPFSSCLQYFPASVSFPMSQPFASSDQSIRASASASVFPINIQGWFPLGLTGLISLLSKGLSRVFSSSTIWNYQLLSTHICLYAHVYMCTLFILGAKWITNENLRYSTGNFTPFSVVTQMGRKS